MSANPAPRRSRFIPWLFVAGFAVVIAVNGALVYFAESSFSGLETEHPYERGLQYNQTLEAAAAQAKLGWRADIALADAGDGKRSLEVSFADGKDRPLDGLQVQAYLVRPSNAGMDVTIALSPRGNGRYAGEVTLPAPGQWDVRVVARDETNSWQRSERLFVK
jgi:nitrogen fixation protein FixH